MSKYIQASVPYPNSFTSGSDSSAMAVRCGRRTRPSSAREIYYFGPLKSASEKFGASHLTPASGPQGKPTQSSPKNIWPQLLEHTLLHVPCSHDLVSLNSLDHDLCGSLWFQVPLPLQALFQLLRVLSIPRVSKCSTLRTTCAGVFHFGVVFFFQKGVRLKSPSL